MCPEEDHTLTMDLSWTQQRQKAADAAGFNIKRGAMKPFISIGY